MQKLSLIRRRGILSILLIFAVMQTHAQVSGYRGHRFFLQANLEAVPTILFPKTSHTSFFKKGIISTSYSLMAGLVNSRHGTITASFDYASTGYNHTMTKYYDYGWANGSYSLKCYTLAIGGRKYTNLAPLGGYLEFAGEISRLDSKLEYYNYREDNFLLNLRELKNRSIDFGFNLGFGYSNIIGKHLILDLGIKSHIGILGAFNEMFNREKDDGNSELSFKARVRKGYYSLLTFKMGVGYLF